MIFINGLLSSAIFALIALFFGNSPIILGLIGFISGIIVGVIFYND